MFCVFKKWCVYFVLGSLILVGLSNRFCQTPLSREIPLAYKEHLKNVSSSYFFLIPLIKQLDDCAPCFALQVEDKEVLGSVGLGLNQQFSFSFQLLDMLSDKSFLRSEKRYSSFGREYEKRAFTIPKITIGPVAFFHPKVFEQVSVPGTHRPSIEIGWRLFLTTNLLLNIPQSTCAFCDSIETLKKHGYEIKRFSKTPLLLDQGFVEFEAEFDGRMIRCMLSTGSRWNILNTPEQDISLAPISHADASKSGQRVTSDLPQERERLVQHKLLKVNDCNLGSIPFHRLSLGLPFHVDALLGMEFFEKHIVFLDFYEGFVYISCAT